MCKCEWQSIESAPKDRSILAWIDWKDTPGPAWGSFDLGGLFHPEHRIGGTDLATYWMDILPPSPIGEQT